MSDSTPMIRLATAALRLARATTDNTGDAWTDHRLIGDAMADVRHWWDRVDEELRKKEADHA